ncbi:acetate--CoA ligase [Desulforhopalus vacuolatus]|uniref:acetate--CoA ligase n=1 Tax=Desulforhopalus vacuolatus TaxID=40414 RepID=UPI001966B4C7|nr:acetate--CoA ligase [Desulforhopalus vacuolatus]MBM9520159.1 acetate--CoA ligase [Desulforhopalus vacuolatus]
MSSDSGFAVRGKEEAYFYSSEEFKAQANLTDEGIFERFKYENFPDYYAEFSELLSWYKPYSKIFDGSDAPCWKWYVDGKLNACYNCVDRHLAELKNKTAIHFVPELEEEQTQHITYQELWVRVNELAALLRDTAGLKKGDRVALHMPMCAELPITMLACARLGLIHNVVFGGFSSSACADRIVDSGSRVLITIDAYYRGGRLLPHKKVDDESCELAEKSGQKVDHVLVWQRYPGTISAGATLTEGRDIVINEELKKYYGVRVEPEEMDSNDPLFLMYTSGTTGKPKGAVHGTGGYLSYVTAMTKYILDLHPEDVYWCTADIGWITGHSFTVYGPLALGGSSVIYEGVPTYPDAGRSWRIAQDLDVNIFHTAPTAIRALRKVGPDEPQKYDFHFKHMTTVGEPIEPEVWRWYESVVGRGKAVICDTYWQTETGGFLCSTVPALQPMKPGSAGPGVPGIHPGIFDEEGNMLEPGCGKAGNVCIRNPWPGCMQVVWGNRERFVNDYYGMYSRLDSKDWHDWLYLTGDAGSMSKDGYVRIHGRIDDVINVSGHRLGTKEIESAALTVEGVAEAAVVAVANEIKGKEPEIYVSLKPGFESSEEFVQKIADAITREIGKIAKCRNVWIVPDMPKTRSGKIMRRVLAAISGKSDVGNVMTLANPEIVETIQNIVK